MTARAISIMDPVGRLTRRRAARSRPSSCRGPDPQARTVRRKHARRRVLDQPDLGQALESGRLYGMRHDGLWFHVGTPDSIAEIEERLEVSPPHSES